MPPCGKNSGGILPPENEGRFLIVWPRGTPSNRKGKTNVGARQILKKKAPMNLHAIGAFVLWFVSPSGLYRRYRNHTGSIAPCPEAENRGFFRRFPVMPEERKSRTNPVKATGHYRR